MVDVEKTLAWLNDLCTVAMTEARNGNTLPAHHLGSNPATQYYFHLVHTLRTITPGQWARDYPHFLKEIDDQRQFQEQQSQALETVGKVKLLEDQNTDLLGKIDALTAKLDALIAAQPKPRKPKVTPEPEPEGDEPPAAPSGEGDNPESDGE